MDTLVGNDYCHTQQSIIDKETKVRLVCGCMVATVAAVAAYGGNGRGSGGRGGRGETATMALRQQGQWWRQDIAAAFVVAAIMAMAVAVAVKCSLAALN